MVAAGDITQESAIATVVERSIAEFGGVDVLVMAAGVGRYGPV
jgi:NAD(P)-dependent dehydrogenase (short-subunit alcohol dehydrogenase family)